MTTNDKTILVTGGAGYIGSFMVKVLLERGYTPVVLDNLSRGNKDAVPENVSFYEGDIGDLEILKKINDEHRIDGVIHFAGFISMKESMENPRIYFEDNTFQTQKLLQNMVDLKLNNIIFSSTAGVYGNPERVPISEDDKKSPTNPYGESKLMVENILKWYRKIHGINYTVLRYFNACGAMPDGSLGERHSPETHIIPIAVKAALEDREFVIFGNDYQTPDGTCVRDYIHVLDLAEAHILALEKIMQNGGGLTYNVGTGKGYSNKEIIDAIRDVTGKELKVRIEGRRPGDADVLVANVEKIKAELSFEPKNSDIHTIISSAWKWHSKEYESQKS